MMPLLSLAPWVRSKLRLPILCILTALLTSCGPEEFVHWSPDGKHALVNGSDGTYLIDDAGTILNKASGSEVWLEHPWMPDSRRVIAVRKVKPRDFAEYASLLGKERADAMAHVADELLAAIRSYKGELDKFPFDDFVNRSETFAAIYDSQWLTSKASAVVFWYLQEKHPREVIELRKKFNEPEDPKEQDSFPPIYELTLRTVLPGDIGPEKALVRSVDEISWVKASPSGSAIAFVKQQPVRPALYVFDLDGQRLLAPVDEGAMQADWTHDGRWLVYLKTRVPYRLLEKEMQLGTVSRRELGKPQGALREQFGDVEDLAGILFHSEARVGCLEDGRVVFAAAALTLPAVSQDAPVVSLFTLRLDAPNLINRLINAEAQARLPNRPDRFALSPDGKRVAIPSDRGGEVAVLTLATGELAQVQPRVPEWSSETQDQLANRAPSPAPTWRTASELCYIIPAGKTPAALRRAEVVLHTVGDQRLHQRVISGSWSDAMTDNFLPRRR